MTSTVETADRTDLEPMVAVSGLLSGVVEVGEILTGPEILDQGYRKIVEAYHRTHKRGEAVDMARLAEALRGSVLDLQGLAAYGAKPEEAIGAARQLRLRHTRQTVGASLRGAADRLIYGNEADAPGALADARKSLDAAEHGAETKGSSIQEILRVDADSIIAGRAERGASCGMASLDHLIGGLHPGELWIVGARPKYGKTSLLTSIAMGANLPAVVFSLEMTRREITRLMVCTLGRIPRDETRLQESNMVKAMGELHKRRLDIIDTPAFTVADIAAECCARRWAKLIFVDYAQILGRIRGTDSGRESLAESVKALKNLAKRQGATVILGSQVNRLGDEKPHTRDLAESDELLRSADAVLLLDWNMETTPPETRFNRSPVQVAVKITQRQGSGGAADLLFHRSQGRFSDAAGDTDED